jgi:glycosyltransferase involved in cell wall biosynthesis
MSTKEVADPSFDNVTVCIAAFNEQRTIGSVVTGIREIGCSSIIVADDGSSDKTSDLAAGAGAEVIKLKNNSGQWAALKAAFAEALRRKAEVIITFDADGQHLPHDIPSLVKPVKNGRADITVGSRSATRWYRKDQHRKIGIRALNLAMWTLTGHRFTDCTSGLTAIRSKTLSQVLPRLSEPQFGRLEFWLVSSMVGARILEIPTTMKPGVRSTKGQLRFATNLLRTVARTYLVSQH